MKRILIVFLIVAMMSGCSSKNDKGAQTTICTNKVTKEPKSQSIQTFVSTEGVVSEWTTESKYTFDSEAHRDSNYENLEPAINLMNKEDNVTATLTKEGSKEFSRKITYDVSEATEKDLKNKYKFPLETKDGKSYISLSNAIDHVEQKDKAQEYKCTTK